MDTQQSIALDSNYEGWVAWIDGHPVLGPDGFVRAYENALPLFEAVPHNSKLAQLINGQKERSRRASGRRTMDWKDLPHERVVQLQLYAFRSAWGDEQQPICSISAQPGRRLRWIQMKRTGIIVSAGANPELAGQSRTGINSWRMGYWDQTVGQMQLYEFNANGSRAPDLELSGSNHPCWDIPLGFGLAPHVLGLTPEQVPPMPRAFAGAPT